MTREHPVHQGRESVASEFFVDGDGNPTGGHTVGHGFEIVWQNGVQAPTGAILEDVIEACLQRLRFFNGEYPSATGELITKFRNRYNSLAISDLEGAQNWLVRRTLERQARGVEGTYEP
jgi:hypothetical protein